MSIDETKRAAQITKAYAEDGEGLTREECKGADFSDAQCNVLVPAIGTGAEGNITADEQKKLEEFGFAKDFIQNLAGDVGNKALQSRVKWLAERINRKTFLNYCWNNCDANERYRNIRELNVVGPTAAPAVPALITALKDEDWDVRGRAAWALGKIGPAAAPAVPSLIAALKDENWIVRHNAVWALGNIGSAAVPAVPALIAALKDKYWGVRDSAARTLAEIGDPLAIPPLQKMIRDDPDAHCRQVAQEAFDQLMEKFR